MESDLQKIINIITNISQRVIKDYGGHREKERCLEGLEFGEWGQISLLSGQGGSR